MTGRGRLWAVLTVLSAAYFLTQLDIAVLAVAVPGITATLHATTEQVVWALTAYTLALAVGLVTAGRLGDLYGHRRIFLAGVTIFTLSSAAAGAAQSPAQLIAARVAQGIGGALLVPQTLAILVNAVPAERRGFALGVRGAVGGIAAILGPVAGGALVGALDWRWIFWVNLPVGAVLLVLAGFWLPEAGPRRPHVLDWPGILLASAALAGFAFFVSQGAHYHWNALLWALLAAAAGCAVALVRQQRGRQSEEPLLPFPLFRVRNYALMLAYSLTTSGTVIGIVLTLSVYFQVGMGLGPFRTGLLIAVASLVSTVADPVAGKLLSVVRAKHLLLAGAASTAAALFWMAGVMGANAGWFAFVAPVGLLGLGNALLFTPLAALAFGEVPGESAGTASGVLGTALQIGSMTGAAVTGAVLGDTTVAGSAGNARTAILVLAVVSVLGGVVSMMVGPSAADPRPVAEPVAEPVAGAA